MEHYLLNNHILLLEREIMEKDSGSYYVSIEYSKDSNPITVFANAMKLFISLENMSGAILGTAGDISASAVVIDIEKGSLKTWLRDKIDIVNEDDIQRYVDNPYEVAGDLLKSTRRGILNLLGSNLPQDVIEAEIINTIGIELKKSGLDAYGYTIKKDKLLVAASDVSQSVKAFPNGVKIGEEGYDDLEIKSTFYHDPLMADGVTVQSRLIRDSFIIKKPDLVGRSKWTLVYDKSIEVDILDTDWLNDLKNRKFAISSGDSIKADMSITTYLDQDFNVLDNKYVITKIYSIDAPTQRVHSTLE